MVDSVNPLDYSKQFIDEDEYVMVCEKISKLKATGEVDLNKDRSTYIMTTDHIYLFAANKKKILTYKIKDVGAIV